MHRINVVAAISIAVFAAACAFRAATESTSLFRPDRPVERNRMVNGVGVAPSSIDRILDNGWTHGNSEWLTKRMGERTMEQPDRSVDSVAFTEWILVSFATRVKRGMTLLEAQAVLQSSMWADDVMVTEYSISGPSLLPLPDHGSRGFSCSFVWLSGEDRYQWTLDIVVAGIGSAYNSDVSEVEHDVIDGPGLFAGEDGGFGEGVIFSYRIGSPEWFDAVVPEGVFSAPRIE